MTENVGMIALQWLDNLLAFSNTLRVSISQCIFLGWLSTIDKLKENSCGNWQHSILARIVSYPPSLPPQPLIHPNNTCRYWISAEAWNNLKIKTRNSWELFFPELINRKTFYAIKIFFYEWNIVWIIIIMIIIHNKCYLNTMIII